MQKCRFFKHLFEVRISAKETSMMTHIASSFHRTLSVSHAVRRRVFVSSSFPSIISPALSLNLQRNVSSRTRASTGPSISTSNISSIGDATASEQQQQQQQPEPAKQKWSLSLLISKARELGPPAVAVYFTLWVIPVATAYLLVVNDTIPYICPLMAIDEYAPTFFADGVRSTLNALNIPIPPKGEALPKQVTGLIWGVIAADLVEPLRIGGTLYLTPKLVSAWKTRRSASSNSIQNSGERG